MADDSSSVQTPGSVTTVSKTSVSSPYALHASDNPGSLITSVTLTGDNYNEWSTEMTNALQAKRKIGFIDGSIVKPSTGDPNLELWLSVNSMIVGWIRSSIEPRVCSTVTFISDSYKLWENLKKRFSVGNKVRVHSLKAQIAACRQDGQSVLEYFGRLSTMWEELAKYKPLLNCSCGAEQKFEEEREEERVHKFLMGLDDSRFGGVCSGIIASDSALDIGEVYAKIIREEHRLLLKRDQEQQQSAIGFTTRYDTPTQSSPARGSTESNQNRPRQGSLLCSHCGRSGHEKSNCWQLVGFPDW